MTIIIGMKAEDWAGALNKLDFPQQPTSRRNDLSTDRNFHDGQWSLSSTELFPKLNGCTKYYDSCTTTVLELESWSRRNFQLNIQRLQELWAYLLISLTFTMTQCV